MKESDSQKTTQVNYPRQIEDYGAGFLPNRLLNRGDFTSSFKTDIWAIGFVPRSAGQNPQSFLLDIDGCIDISIMFRFTAWAIPMPDIKR